MKRFTEHERSASAHWDRGNRLRGDEMRLEKTVTIDAPANEIWAVMADIERWPEWTASVKRAERLDAGDLRIGSEAILRQPRVPRMTWRVTELTEGRSFTWEAASPGTKSIANHRIETLPNGQCRVTLTLDQSGIAMMLLGPIMARMSRRYMAMEAEGLKQRCESGPVRERSRPA